MAIQSGEDVLRRLGIGLGESAFRIGLADEVLSPEELLPRAKSFVEKIATKGPVAIGAAKEAMRRGAAMSMGDALSLESQHFSWLFATEDQKEGMAAFIEKRTANFKGR